MSEKPGRLPLPKLLHRQISQRSRLSLMGQPFGLAVRRSRYRRAELVRQHPKIPQQQLCCTTIRDLSGLCLAPTHPSAVLYRPCRQLQEHISSLKFTWPKEITQDAVVQTDQVSTPTTPKIHFFRLISPSFHPQTNKKKWGSNLICSAAADSHRLPKVTKKRRDL